MTVLVRLIQALKTYPELLAALLCGVLVCLGWLSLQQGWTGLGLLILPAAYVIGGYESAREGLTTLIQEKELDVDLLMVVAALGAAVLGFWRSEYFFIVDGAILILIFAISGGLETVAMQRTARSIRSLMNLSTDTARRIDSRGEALVAVSQLKIGDRLLVKPGELIPTDSRVLAGGSTVNEAAITGESLPVEKMPGDPVFAGTLNGYGALHLEVDQPPESSLLQRVIRLVEQAQTEKPPSQQLIERFERGYARVIVLSGLLLGLLPPFLWGWSWETTIYRALIFLVVASPCALMAAIMPTLLSGIANGARQGILFKNGAQLELMARVRAIAFDKTGTLTTGQPQVCQIIPALGYSATDVLQLAASLESHSEHPLGEAICRYAQQVGGSTNLPVTAVQAHPGEGITGIMEGKLIRLGTLSLVSSQVLAVDLQQQGEELQHQGKTVVWLSVADQILGLVAIADTLRPEATQVINNLKQLGIEEIVILTGDNAQTAESVAAAIGIPRVHANLLPEDKLKVIRQLQQQYGTVAMVGDGINDAPALAQASVGIAMGGTGSDVALETADIVLMADRLEKLITAIRLGRRSQAIVKQNITFALGFILLLLIANFAGEITLPLGVIGHEGSTVLVTLSGLRLLRD